MSLFSPPKNGGLLSGPPDHYLDASSYEQMKRSVLGQMYAAGQSPQTPVDLIGMIRMRLRKNVGEKLFDFIAAHQHADTVFVFIVHDGKNVVIKDNEKLFPSDALITQIRLLQQ